MSWGRRNGERRRVKVPVTFEVGGESRPGLVTDISRCGMFVSTEVSHRLTQGTQTLHFCSRECLERYQKEAAHAAS